MCPFLAKVILERDVCFLVPDDHSDSTSVTPGLGVLPAHTFVTACLAFQRAGQLRTRVRELGIAGSTNAVLQSCS